ncbi:MAG TPA: cysteine desulfurase [Ghiorsea sp.]|nr:cysteine desulfurase [Ghiorsea sp.]
MKQYYLDYNATCPQLSEVTEVMHDVANTAFGNPSSLHWAGRNARRKLDDARESLAEYLKVESGSVVFTSGGTESNNMVIQGVMASSVSGHIVLSAIEHPAILQTVEVWAKRYPSWTYTLVKPDKDGKIDATTFMAACKEDTKLACLMWANNETGVVQPVFEVSQTCKVKNIPFFVDAVQALGKFEVDLMALDADFVSFSAHKIGGPRGMGALVMKRGLKLESLMVGGGQERGRRSGTENVAGAAGFAAALGKLDYSKLTDLRDYFEVKLKQAIPKAQLFGATHARTANTSMFCIPGLEGETLLMQMDLMGFAVASGSACSSGKREPSHVLLAMGAPDVQARSSLRVSFGVGDDEAVADALITGLLKVQNRLRQMSGRG